MRRCDWALLRDFSDVGWHRNIQYDVRAGAESKVILKQHLLISHQAQFIKTENTKKLQFGQGSRLVAKNIKIPTVLTYLHSFNCVVPYL